MATLRAYLCDLKYSIGENITVHLFCRTEEGRLIVIRDYYRPNFYVLPAQNIDMIQLRAKIARLKFDENNYVSETNVVKKIINCKEEKFIKINVSRPESVPHVRGTIEKWDSITHCFEDDISLTRKYMLENKLSPFSIFEAEIVDNNEVENGYPSYKLVKITKRDIMFARPSVLSVNISYLEDDKGNKIFSAISYSGDNFNKLITWKDTEFNVPELKRVKSEEDLLIDFKKTMQDHKPDLIIFEDRNICLYNIIQRAKKYKIRMNINFDLSDPFINRISKRTRTIGINEVFMKNIISNFTDISSIDIPEAYKDVGGLIDLPSSTFSKGDQLINVIFQRSRLDFQLFDSLYTNLTELLRLVGLRIGDLLNFSLKTVLEWILIQESMEKNHIVPNKPSVDDKTRKEFSISKYQPIIDPVAGIYDNLVVIDLSSIYPQIIINNNISPDTINCTCCSSICTKTRGILPNVMIDLLARIERIDAALSKDKNENLIRRKELLRKILNLFYQYLNTPYSRWHSIKLIEELNTRARKEISSIINLTGNRGSVVYSDYNEIFISTKHDITELIEDISNKLPSAFSVKIKDVYSKGLFLPRQETRRTKKRFALMDDRKNIIDYNLTRYTQPNYIKKTVKDILRLIFESPKDEMIEFVRKRMDRLQRNEVETQDLIIKSKLIRKVEEYSHKTIQHNIIGYMNKKGKTVKKNDYIEYVIADVNEPISRRAKLPEDMENSKYDADYYVEKMLIPAIEDLLLLRGITIEEIKEPKSQSELGRFI